MDAITTCLLLMSAVLCSSWITRALPLAIPAPLVQIALGAGIAIGTDYAVVLDPHVFFALFIPALLFLDGWRIPKDDLTRDLRTILEMSIGLVFATVVALGFLIHWVIPELPMPIAFALAAILSPTDPVAVSGITSRLHMPKRLHHVLEGEALLNDASGLSAFRLALAVMATGHFTIFGAAGSFLLMALGGVVIGVGLTWAIIGMRDLVTRKAGEEQGSAILFSLLIPFAVYFAAEHFHVSGILAAAAAGITMSFAEMRGSTGATTRMRRNTVWDMLAFSANGMIFVLLGEQFPKILASAPRAMEQAGGGHPLWLAVYIVFTLIGLFGLRYIWVWGTMKINRLTQIQKAKKAGEEVENVSVSWRIPATATLAGARGSITLAGIMTIPLGLPGRDLAIFIATGIILGSMLIAAIALPWLLRDLEMPEDETREKLDAARALAARAAIRVIEEEAHSLSEGRADADIYNEAAGRAMEIYRMRLDAGDFSGDAREAQIQSAEIERKLRLHGLKAERNELYRLMKHKKLPEALGRKLVREADLSEARLSDD